jgi:hypothetical protein
LQSAANVQWQAHMLFDPKHENTSQRLIDELARLSAPTAELFSEIVVRTCTRVPALNSGLNRLEPLIAAGAWSDAALTLIELELPQWKLRRLVFDEGEWICSLSRWRNLPEGIDDTIDAHHEVLPLAILGAFLEARRDSSMPRQTTVPRIRAEASAGTCCDNFA